MNYESVSKVVSFEFSIKLDLNHDVPLRRV